jgi:STE24 endopeptidase
MSSATAIAPPVDSPAARRYNRIRRWIGVTDFVLSLILMLALLVTGWSGTLRDIAYKATFQHYGLAVFLYVLMLMVLAKALGFGLDYYSFRLEHRYQLSNLRTRAWIVDELKGFLVGVVLGGIVVEVLYFIMREAPEHWWLIAWAVFLGLFVLLAQLAPVVLFPIFYKFAPLDNEELKERLVRLGERAGTQIRGVYQWKLSEKSKKANAALANYSTDEIEAVLAHELGHHVHRHIFKSILVQAGITFVGFWAANWVLHYAVDRVHMFETLSDFANLPLLMLVATLLSFLVLPLLNAYSRFNERQADRYAFRSIAAVEPFISAMNKLAEQNLAERAPSQWVERLFHSHPSISRRVGAARAWARTQPRSARST